MFVQYELQPFRWALFNVGLACRCFLSDITGQYFSCYFSNANAAKDDDGHRSDDEIYRGRVNLRPTT